MKNSKVQKNNLETNVRELTKKGFKLLETKELQLKDAKIYALYNNTDKAKEIIDKNIKKQNYDIVDFLEVLSIFFKQKNSKLHKEKKLKADHNLKKDIKKYFRPLKHIFKELEKQFDEDYLLIKDKDSCYRATTNIKLLFSLEEISLALSLCEYEKESRNFFELKSKIELGIQRYILYEKDNTMLSEFNSHGAYIQANAMEISELQQYYEISIAPELKNIEKENFIIFLEQLKTLQRKNHNQFKEEMLKKYNIIKHFPQLIMSLKEYKLREKIIKSINKNFEDDKIILKKEKLVLINPNNKQSIVQTLELLKNEQ